MESTPIVNRSAAICLLVLANILWGSSYVVAKVALQEIPPPLLGSLRVLLATAILWPILLWRSRARAPSWRPIEPIARGDALRLAGLGLLGIGASYLLDYWGISLSTATAASLMIIAEVIFTALLASMLAGERLGHRKRVGIVIGIAGVLTLVLGNSVSGGTAGGWARVAGDALILACLLCEAVYTVFGAGLARKYQPLTVLVWAHTGSLLLWLPILLWYLASGRFPGLSMAAVAGVLYLASVTSALCYLIWFSVIRVAGSAVGAVSLFVQPLVGSLLGLALLGDPLTLALLAGAALIFAALYMITVPERSLSLAGDGVSDEVVILDV
jgi:drug/metabolite transporter (DMT)-like permease